MYRLPNHRHVDHGLVSESGGRLVKSPNSRLTRLRTFEVLVPDLSDNQKPCEIAKSLS
jgi:hypothetical protein